MPTGYQYVWTGDISGSFDIAGNWENEQSGTTATAVPGIDDSAAIMAQGTITGTSSVYTLGLTGTGTGLAIGGQLDGQFVGIAGTLSIGSGDSLAADVNASVQNAALLTIGYGANAIVNVAAGGTISASWNGAYGVDFIVGGVGTNGTLNLAGAGATCSTGEDGMQIGNGGQGLIAISNGGTLAAGTGAPVNWIGAAIGLPGGSGTLSVDGAGSKAVLGDILSVGYGGTGVLSVTNGATLVAGDGAHSLTIGDLDGADAGTGTASILNAAAMLNGLIAVGAYGNGNLTIGGTSSVTQTASAGNGTASEWSVLVAEAAGVTGSMLVALGTNLTLSRGIGVGASGTGSLTIAYAVVDVNAPAGPGLLALELGLGAGATGTTLIEGGVFKDAEDAGVVVGGAGTGTLTVNQGGQLLCGGSTTQAGFVLGDASGAAGTATVTGSASLLSCAGQVLIGNLGNGALTVTSGGSLVAGSLPTAAGLILGNGSGTGSFTLSNGGIATVTGQIGAGVQASGVIVISGGSTLTATASNAPALEFGEDAGASGSGTITDAGTKVTLNGGLTVGGYGSGTLTIQNGADVSTSSTTAALPGFALAAGPGSSAMTVTGTNTMLVDSGQFIVGGLGTGVLTIAGGAQVDVTVPASQNLPPAVISADQGGTASSVTVTGAGSAWNITGQLLVGHAAAGALTISAGGTVTAGAIAESDVLGGNGTIVVTGAGSTLTAASLAIGSTGNAHGNFSVLSGGQATIGGAIVNLGTISVSGGTLSCLGNLSGSGTLLIGGGGVFHLGGKETGEVLGFAAGGGTLTAVTTADLTTEIKGWSKGDVIDLTGIVAVKETASGHVLKLIDDGHVVGTLTFATAVNAKEFSVGSDHHGGTVINFV